MKFKPSRYKQQQNGWGDFSLLCLENDGSKELIKEHLTAVISNWSLSEEIVRLAQIGQIVNLEKEYQYHKNNCPNSHLEPVTNPDAFYKKGVSKSNSPRYQCKTCLKNTNILPGQAEAFNYGQKRNEVLNQFVVLVFEKVSVRGICNALKISPTTYYHKIDWIYKKCLEFTERYETKLLSKMSFDRLWINSDGMIYNLNNIRRKGYAKDRKPRNMMEDKLQTYIACSTDMLTYYAFRIDLAYDSEMTLDVVEEDTKLYHCDHSYSFLGKNDRLLFPFCPQPPVSMDEQSEENYLTELIKFRERQKYVEGCHISPKYTYTAHYFLLQKQLRANEWIFVSDDDKSLQNAAFRVFKSQFLNDRAKYFTCQADKSLNLFDAGTESMKRKNDIRTWGRANGVSGSLYNIAYEWLKDELKQYPIYDSQEIHGVQRPKRSDKKIEHPLPDKAEGKRYVNLISFSPSIDREQLAELVMQVNSRAVDGVFHMIRRSLNILERPLMTARGDGKSYIYSNYNPKYAHQLLTIFRTVYNFCWVRNYGKEKMTPAQKLGLAKKVYEYKDIVYFR